MRFRKISKFSRFAALSAAMALAVAAFGVDGSQKNTVFAEKADAAQEVADSDPTKLLDQCFGEVVMYKWRLATNKNNVFPVESDQLYPMMIIWDYESGSWPGYTPEYEAGFQEAWNAYMAKCSEIEKDLKEKYHVDKINGGTKEYQEFETLIAPYQEAFAEKIQYWHDHEKMINTYLAGKAPDNIWRGENAPGSYPGVTSAHTVSDRATGIGKAIRDIYKGDQATAESYTYYFDSHATRLDSQVDPSEELFYTSTDRNVPYAHFVSNNSGMMHYNLRLASSNDTEYWLHPRDDETLSFRNSEIQDSNWYFSARSNNRFALGHSRPNANDAFLCNRAGVIAVRNNDEYHTSAKVYIGTKMRFSCINGGTVVGMNNVLSITEGRYVNAKGDEEPTNGVILPQGQTLKIEKGGVLEVSANFINNGTIENDGGTIIIRNGGTIFPFLQGNDSEYKTGLTDKSNGCGRILCNGGDIIIKQGGALYAGMLDESCSEVDFRLDNGSTLINMGLLVYGGITLGTDARIELRKTSLSYGGMYFASLISETEWGEYKKMKQMPCEFNDDFHLRYNLTASIVSYGNMTQLSGIGLAGRGIHLPSGNVGGTARYHVAIQEGAEQYLLDPCLKANGIITETLKL